MLTANHFPLVQHLIVREVVAIALTFQLGIDVAIVMALLELFEDLRIVRGRIVVSARSGGVFYHLIEFAVDRDNVGAYL